MQAWVTRLHWWEFLVRREDVLVCPFTIPHLTVAGSSRYGLWAFEHRHITNARQKQRAIAADYEKGHGLWLWGDSCRLPQLYFGRQVNGGVVMRGRIPEEQAQGKMASSISDTTCEECTRQLSLGLKFHIYLYDYLIVFSLIGSLRMGTLSPAIQFL